MRADYHEFNGNWFKDCSRCKKHFAAETIEDLRAFFNKNSCTKDSLDYWCLECRAEDRKIKQYKRPIVGRPTKIKNKHPLYGTYKNIWARCRNESCKNYKYYGARGISLDPRWDDFWTFVSDMGPKPSPKHSVERINNDGNYCKENCKWATAAEQARNKRKPQKRVKP